jgi:hypothetical protein
MPEVRRWAAIVLWVVLATAGPVGASNPSAVYYRVFLVDGTSIATYGEFARVADRVVFSMRVGGSDEAPALQLVSLPASKVNWPETDRYADAARAAHYAATRGEADYAALNDYIAGTLNDIALTNSPSLQLQMAETARQYLAEWSRSSYGYRAQDVAQLSSMLDEAAAELRARNGAVEGSSRSFDLQLVAIVGPPPEVPLLPAPGLRDSIQQALAAAAAVDDPGERKALLLTAHRALAGVKEPWAGPLTRDATRQLETEARIDAAYARVARTAIARADQRVERADVRGLQAVIAEVLTHDDRLGRRRQAEVSALLATLDVRLDAARRLRLALDRWELNEDSYRRYARAIRRAMTIIRRLRGPMEDIRTLAGPDGVDLARAKSRADEASLALGRIDPPADLDPVHALFVSAVKLAASACTQRLDAVRSGEVKTAWAASSAAAGALMLLDRAQEDLTRWLKRPSHP